MGVVVAVVLLVVAVGSYVTWTAGRLDRLTARVESAWNALDAQLVRRAAAASDLAAHLRRRRLVDEEVALALQHAAAATRGASEEREARENELSRAVRDVLEAVDGRGGKTEALADELRTAGTRVRLARQFYNDAVRDNLTRRRRWLPRLLTVRHRDEPRRTFFEIDDSPAADALAGT
ncbi:MAG TPA: NUDIX hydrolase [Mycobacteriales bacterium]|nr:NUDIX hydrolase [Mycobacteriales bacterium]